MHCCYVCFPFLCWVKFCDCFRQVFILFGTQKKCSLVALDRWLSYTVTTVWEFAWVDSALVILDEWLSYRGGRLNRFDCIWKFPWKSETNFFDPFCEPFLINQGKNFEKFRKMSSIFEFSISKLGYMAIFMKICGKKISTHFVGHFWLSKAKMKVKMKKYREMSSNFESSWSRLVYAVVFKKISEKKFDPF